MVRLGLALFAENPTSSLSIRPASRKALIGLFFWRLPEVWFGREDR
jgi:hypothetical protein